VKTKIKAILKTGFIMAVLVISVLATDLKVGDRAPDFSLTSSDGNVVRLGDLLGKQKTVLVFFRTLT
jgi:peroxiredoxin